jgi:hypothetical protein
LTDLKEKVFQDLFAAGSVYHFRMKLNTIDLPTFMGHAGKGILASPDDDKIGWESFNPVSVTHPHLSFLGQVLKKRAPVNDLEHGLAVFSILRRSHLSPVVVGHELHSIADPQEGALKVVEFFLGMGSPFGENRIGASRKHNPLGLTGFDLLPRGVKRQDFRVHSSLTNTAGDQLSILGSKVKDEDGFLSHDQSKFQVPSFK